MTCWSPLQTIHRYRDMIYDTYYLLIEVKFSRHECAMDSSRHCFWVLWNSSVVWTLVQPAVGIWYHMHAFDAFLVFSKQQQWYQGGTAVFLFQRVPKQKQKTHYIEACHAGPCRLKTICRGQKLGGEAPTGTPLAGCYDLWYNTYHTLTHNVSNSIQQYITRYARTYQVPGTSHVRVRLRVITVALLNTPK